MQPKPIPAIDLKAVIYIGASSVSMLLTCEATGAEVDFLEQSIPLAHDIFAHDKISKKAMERAVNIISRYFDNIAEFGPQKEDNIQIVATNILYEADNKEQFLTRLQIACNHPISILDDGEMTRLLYLKTRRRLRDTPVMQKCTTLVIHVGPGNTRAIQFSKGNIVTYKSYRLGTHRTAEAVDSLNLSGKPLLKVIKEHSGGQISALLHDFKNSNIEAIVMIGYEIQNMSSNLLRKNSDKISVAKLEELCSKLSSKNIDQIVKAYPLDYQSAEAAVPAIEINLAIAQGLGLTCAFLPGSDYEKGLLSDLSNKQSFTKSFEHEVIQSALQLSEKFAVHPNHAKQVCNLCETLFIELKDIHKLNSHDLLLLRSAAIVHEVGGFIHSQAHHKHSLYLIMHSEIFGLSKEDVNIIALVSRYHRNSPPKPNHLIFRDLSSKDKIRVTKLAAILRVADALDRTHTGRIGNVKISIRKRTLHIHLQDVPDASVERLAMESKGDLLQDVFGLEINIKEST